MLTSATVMQQSIHFTAVHRSVEAILAIINIVASLILCGVAGASLNQVDAATSYISNNTLFTAPSMGKPATLIAIVAALLSIPVCFIVTLVRLRQIRRLHLADSETHVVINYLSVFIGGFVIGGFGAAGMLSAITASDWAEYANILMLDQINTDFIKSSGSKLVTGLYCYRACQFLIGTSIISFIAFVLRTTFMVYEVLIRFWKASKVYHNEAP